MTLVTELSEIRTPFLTALGTFGSFIGEEVFLLAVVGVLYWCVDKRFTWRIIFTYTLSASLAEILKIIFCVPRPWLRDGGAEAVSWAEKYETGFSFPSVHAAAVTSMAMPFFLNIKRIPVRIVSLLLIVFTAVSRIYLGVNTLADIAAAVVLTVIVSILVNKFTDEIVLDKSHYKTAVSLLCLLPLVGIMIALARYYNGAVDHESIKGMLRTAGAAMGWALSWYIEKQYINFNESCSRWWKNLLKGFLGICILLAVRFWLEFLSGLISSDFWPGDLLGSFISVVVGFTIYPIFIKKFFK